MNSPALNIKSIWTWSLERFPPINFISAYLLYALSAAMTRHDFYGVGRFRLNWSDLLCGLALTLHFLVLRVLDEHKDYAVDIRAHPERILSRGIVSLKSLRVVGVTAAVVSLAITLAIGEKQAWLAWSLMTFWTSLMSFEFFCGQWLNRNLIVYSVSHMLVLPFMIFWAATLAEPRASMAHSLPYLLVFTFLNGLLYEVVRKIKGREEEIPAVITFSKTWGAAGACRVAFCLLSLSCLTFGTLTSRLYGTSIIYQLPLLWNVCSSGNGA